MKYGSIPSSSSLINLIFNFVFWQCLIGGAITKILGFAAGIAVVAGIVTLGSLLIKSGGGKAPEQPPIVATTVETKTGTTETTTKSTATTSTVSTTFTAKSGTYTAVSSVSSTASTTAKAVSDENNAVADNKTEKTSEYIIEGGNIDEESARYIEVAKNMADDYNTLINSNYCFNLSDTFTINVDYYEPDTNEFSHTAQDTFYRLADEKCDTLEKFRKLSA